MIGINETFDRITYQPLNEAITYCIGRVNGITCEGKLNQLLTMHRSNKRMIINKCAVPVELEAYLNSRIDWMDERMAYYFQMFESFRDSNDNGEMTPVCLALMPYIRYGFMPYRPMSEIAEELKAMSWEDKRLSILVNYISAGCEVDDMDGESTEALVRHLDGMNMTPDEKWRSIRLLANFDACVDELAQLLQPIIDEICSYLDTRSEWLEACADELNNTDCREYLTRNGVAFTDAAHSPSFIVSVLDIMCLRICASTSAPRQIVQVGCAAYLCAFLKLSSGQPASCFEMLKAIGDQTRFDALCKLRNTQLDVQSLAEKCGMAPSTMYHHIGRLQKHGLILVCDKESGHFTYSINAKNVDYMLQRLRELLLG